MVGILITGHGEFATGSLSAVHLIAGASEQVRAVAFLEGMTPEDLKDNMRKAFAEMGTEEILVLADLAGGTPFRSATELQMELTDKKIRVMAGTNLPAMIAASFSKDFMGVDDLAAEVAQSAKEGIVDLDAEEETAEEPDFGGEGL